MMQRDRHAQYFETGSRARGRGKIIYVMSEILEEAAEEDVHPTLVVAEAEHPIQIAVAVGKGDSSSQALKWVLDNVVPPGGLLHLLHVQAPVRYIPSPMGSNIPVEQASEDVANRFKMQRFMETEKLLHQYKKMCDDRQVTAEVCCAEGEVIQKELVDQITRLCVAKLVLGTSPQSRITKALKRPTISSFVAKHAPDFCTVVVICKGKLHSVKDAARPPQP